MYVRNMPGFTAEAALYQLKASYRVGHTDNRGKASDIHAAARMGLQQPLTGVKQGTNGVPDCAVCFGFCYAICELIGESDCVNRCYNICCKEGGSGGGGPVIIA